LAEKELQKKKNNFLLASTLPQSQSSLLGQVHHPDNSAEAPAGNASPTVRIHSDIY
jgi:hypothetical protein